MKLEIDLVADAATFVWGDRAEGRSTVTEVPGRGARLLLNAAGDVVGVEVLGWSYRTADPSDVQVRVIGVGEVLEDDDSLALALTAPASEIVTTPAGRPVDEAGMPMFSAPEAAAIIGQERSWISRQLNTGRLRGRKVGRQWWVTQQWIDDYRQRISA